MPVRFLFTSLVLAFLGTAEAATCTTGQTAFFATFGDNTQTDDGVGSVDDAAASLYNMPAAFLTMAAAQFGNGIARTDEMVVDATHPIVLQGYTPFDYDTTESAFLRFDFYFSTYSNSEAFAILDDTFAGSVVTFAYYDRLVTQLRRFGVNSPMWISVRLDLLTGNAFASSIDAFGNTVVDFGQFATFGDDPADDGQLYYILKLAGEGHLYAWLFDDMPLGYVALYGITEPVCP
ncbi:MAG: hypothetical protein Q8P41_08770 [Pseudomonadota bacterium]|nr:hypothetical protein [Pseudomonadota bacterium]